MKNITFVLFLSITMIFSSSVYAEHHYSEGHDSGSYQSEYHHADSHHSEHHHSEPYHSEHYSRNYRPDDYDKSFVPLDLFIYRPLGLLTTILGTAVFIGASPLTAFASIPAPHDAFHKTANIFIMAPANYTFSRPLGDTSRFQFPDP